ncbi:short-chain fatty acyl-CoA regulator family protein [Aquincola sp. MAHUQ-54]|uniref:Short-chain fatty acyl-CoA regulator family protein n=1 Tax=Aquincola agrisoli TaxID=3119538 RepID=A0AAW9QG96_9BURK
MARVDPRSGRKLFIGARVRRQREQRGFSQGVLAARLGLSLSYVSQIENDQRPVTPAVLLKLAEVFGGDAVQFSEQDDQRLLAELDVALHDRGLGAHRVAPAPLARMVAQAPELVQAFLTLHERHQRLQEEHAQTIDRFYGELGGDHLRGPIAPPPHEAVREHFNRLENYVDALDRAAEQLAETEGVQPGERASAMRRVLREVCGVEVAEAPTMGADGALRRFEPARRRLHVPAHLSDAQQAYQMATQYALLACRAPIDAVIQAAGFADAETRALAWPGLAHYFAGALVLPYGRFLAEARAVRYDIELLAQRFQVSFETVCHRLSTMQRPGARGVPVYFVRVDQAGNISKRQSATAFHFARHGGACPLWQVHEAFTQPGRILTQIAEMPDGTRFFGIARTIERGGGGYLARRKLFAVGLGCELSHAHELVYADGLNLAAPAPVVPIGPGCRVCPRADCVQRAFPPAGKPLVVDEDSESLVPYRFEG